MAEIRDLLSELQRYEQEASQEKHQLPGYMSLAVNHPGILAYQVKTQPHYQKDMQRASFLGKVAGMRDQMVQEGRGLEYEQSLHPSLRSAVERRQEQASPYWNRGVLAYGQPLRNGTDWMQSVSSTGLNAARMVAGVPDADVDFEKSSDRAMLGIPGALMNGGNDHQTAWEAERVAEENKPIVDMGFVTQPTQKGARVLPTPSPYEAYAMQGMTDGRQVAGEMGVHGAAGKVLGLGIDIATDPVSEFTSGIRALLKGQTGRAALAFGSEAALPGAFLGSSEYLERQALENTRRNGYAQSTQGR